MAVSYCLQRGFLPANVSFAQTVKPTVGEFSPRWNDVVSFKVIHQLEDMSTNTNTNLGMYGIFVSMIGLKYSVNT